MDVHPPVIDSFHEAMNEKKKSLVICNHFGDCL